MNQQPFDQPPWATPQPPHAPPTRPYLPARAPQSTWPTVFGVLATVFGGLGVLGYVFALVVQGITAAVSKADVSGFPPMFHEQVWQGWPLVVSMVTTSLSVILLIGGIGLLRRRRWAVKLLTIWAISDIVFVPLSIAVQYPAMRAQMQAISGEMKAEFDRGIQKTGTPAPFSSTIFDFFFEFGLVFGIGVGLLWGWTLPAVLLIWFARRRIKNEIAAWASRAL